MCQSGIPHQAERLGLQSHLEASADRVAQWDRRSLREGIDSDAAIREAAADE